MRSRPRKNWHRIGLASSGKSGFNAGHVLTCLDVNLIHAPRASRILSFRRWPVSALHLAHVDCVRIDYAQPVLS